MGRHTLKTEVTLESKIYDGPLSEVYNAKYGEFPCVIKLPKFGKEEKLEEEIRTYRRLKTHKNLLKYVGTTKINGKKGLVLERFNGSNIEDKVWKILRNEDLQFKFAEQFLTIFKYIKDNNVEYEDNFARNVMVNLNTEELKLIDFNFSSSGAKLSRHYYSSIEQKPETDTMRAGDFMYFLFTGTKTNSRYNIPVYESNKRLNSSIAYKINLLIQRCWNEEYSSAREVLTEFENIKREWSEEKRKKKKKTKNSINNHEALQKNTEEYIRERITNKNGIPNLFKLEKELAELVVNNAKDNYQRALLVNYYNAYRVEYGDDKPTVLLGFLFNKTDKGLEVNINEYIHRLAGTMHVNLNTNSRLKKTEDLKLLALNKIGLTNLIEIAEKAIESEYVRRQSVDKISRKIRITKESLQNFIKNYPFEEKEYILINIEPSYLVQAVLNNGPLVPYTPPYKIKTVLRELKEGFGPWEIGNTKQYEKRIMNVLQEFNNIIKSSPIDDGTKRGLIKDLSEVHRYILPNRLRRVLTGTGYILEALTDPQNYQN